MWGFRIGRNGSKGHRQGRAEAYRAGVPVPITRHHLALAEAARWLDDALQPSPHAVYLRSNGAYEPAVVNGIEDAPVFAAEGSLSRALRLSSGPVMTTRSHRARRLDEALDPVDRESLKRAGAIALVPLSADRELEAFLLVGGPLGAFDPERLAPALAPVSACLRIARDGALWLGSEPARPAAGAAAASW
jgi:hypothetical protein